MSFIIETRLWLGRVNAQGTSKQVCHGNQQIHYISVGGNLLHTYLQWAREFAMPRSECLAVLGACIMREGGLQVINAIAKETKHYLSTQLGTLVQIRTCNENIQCMPQGAK